MKIMSQEQIFLKFLKFRNTFTKKGITQEGIAEAIGIPTDSVRSIIANLRNKKCYPIIDSTKPNPLTGYNKKGYRLAESLNELQEWKLKNRNRSEGCKLGRPMY